MWGSAYRTLLQPSVWALRRARSRVANRFDPPVLVLIYHRVTRLARDPQLLAVSPENFRAQMRYLKERHPVLRFEDDWSQVREPSVVVTFDDGYADNALEALPILEEVGVPATFFVATGTLGTDREFWWDEVERILSGAGPFPDSFTLEAPPAGRTFPTARPEQRQALYGAVLQTMMRLDPARRDELLARLRAWASVGERDEQHPMTLEELSTLAASELVTIGAHTVSHTPLASLTPAAQREEILSSKRYLEAALEREIQVFSYPFGRRCDYTAASVRFCREAGFVRAAANFPGQAHRWTDPFQVPRQLVRDWPAPLFAEKLEGYWTL